jgi:prefoldin alpha subunit
VRVDKKELQEIIIQLQEYQGRAEAYQRQLALIDVSLGEHEGVIKTLKEVDEIKTSGDIMIPIGAGTFMHATITEADRVLVGLGAGISAEKSVNEAKDAMMERKTQLSKIHERLSKNLREVYNEMQKLQVKAAQYR